LMAFLEAHSAYSFSCAQASAFESKPALPLVQKTNDDADPSVAELRKVHTVVDSI